MADIAMDSLRVNVERALKDTGVSSAAIDQLLEEIRDSLWLALVQQSTQVETLRSAAEGWGDGSEGFPYHWLLERADEAENGKTPNWEAS